MNSIVQLRSKLAELGLETKGTKTQLANRLKKANSSKRRSKACGLYLVFDVEATCQESNEGFEQEIIEFPVVLVNSNMEIIDEFHSYVRPVRNPRLSRFCVELTGIAQETVDAAPVFEKVIEQFTKWLESHLARIRGEVGEEDLEMEGMHRIKTLLRDFVFVTDGPWDIRDFIRKQFAYTETPVPAIFHEWIDLRAVFKSNMKKHPSKVNLNNMLSRLGLSFEGRPHSGIDDARNIARILIALQKSGKAIHIFSSYHKQVGLLPDHRKDVFVAQSVDRPICGETANL